MINNVTRENQDIVEHMDNYFNLIDKRFNHQREELLYISEKLKDMEKEDVSKVLDMFGDILTRHYLGKQKMIGNLFTYSEIEPFINYLDTYLIGQGGGNKEKLNNLSNYLVGERFDYPTQRLIRLSILDKYFAPYLEK